MAQGTFKTQNVVFLCSQLRNEHRSTLGTAQRLSFVHLELRKECLTDFGNCQKVSYRHWLGRDDACSDGTSANALATLQRDWENSVQPLRKPTQMLPFPTASEFHSIFTNGI